MLFFSRDVAGSNIAELASKHMQFCERSNVVSHSTYESPRLSQRGRVYGRRCIPSIGSSAALARRSMIKTGVDACHYRINGYPAARNDGKLLVFQSGNAIRAGKRSHEDSLKCMFKFNQWVRRTCGSHHEWHTAIDNPNMVLSGKLKRPVSSKFKSHWRCNYSVKFPGVAVKTRSSTTPEVYPKSAAFIIPGTTTVDSLAAAIEAINEALDETADA